MDQGVALTLLTMRTRLGMVMRPEGAGRASPIESSSSRDLGDYTNLALLCEAPYQVNAVFRHAEGKAEAGEGDGVKRSLNVQGENFQVLVSAHGLLGAGLKQVHGIKGLHSGREAKDTVFKEVVALQCVDQATG